MHRSVCHSADVLLVKMRIFIHVHRCESCIRNVVSDEVVGPLCVRTSPLAKHCDAGPCVTCARHVSHVGTCASLFVEVSHKNKSLIRCTDPTYRTGTIIKKKRASKRKSPMRPSAIMYTGTAQHEQTGSRRRAHHIPGRTGEYRLVNSGFVLQKRPITTVSQQSGLEDPNVPQ